MEINMGFNRGDRVEIVSDCKFKGMTGKLQQYIPDGPTRGYFLVALENDTGPARYFKEYELDLTCDKDHIDSSL